ncbi:uncharacterized protein MELLADRAFT_106620 [Melampsora larici-populina 98AG31]|uniref:Uncharacterized protein n=1 Tax=Melampsora larici-populina (strain 98AG31 / pathotype 3-4-7) TaxID=747676 RepID=F4RM34_MELLP|nr:uncharacterized protein MELLADRAFT_106620 [Melampsora larici-populina 98AG31]EGG06653.1 hypothetical protein MELLADRAFT_106620 [Melampsora larici-populina 98AG31]
MQIGGMQSHYWKKGAPARSIKALNSSVAAVLPKSTEFISISLAKFTRILLSYDKVSKSYPSKPTPEELQNLPTLNQQDIISDERVFSTTVVEAGSTSDKRAILYFSADLNNYNIGRATFDWSASDNSQWNRTMAVFVTKHWLHAKKQGWFDHKPLDQSHCTQGNCIGLVLRWIRGRSEEIRTARRSPDKVLLKEQARKKRMLFEYWQQSLSLVIEAEASDMMPDPDCCSDTEWEPDQTHYNWIDVIWRSQQYSQILHKLDELSYKVKASVSSPLLARRRFDQCRLEASKVNQKAPVCCGLPENCYEQVFLANLTEEARTALRMKPASNLLNTLPSQIVNKLP